MDVAVFISICSDDAAPKHGEDMLSPEQIQKLESIPDWHKFVAKTEMEDWSDVDKARMQELEEELLKVEPREKLKRSQRLAAYLHATFVVAEIQDHEFFESTYQSLFEKVMKAATDVELHNITDLHSTNEARQEVGQ